MRAKKAALVLGLCLLIAHPEAPLAETELQYQNRGDRYEGIKANPVGGEDVHVISVLVDYREPFSKLPDRLRLKFYLPEETDVAVTVRELDFDTFYWLDRVKPKQPWVQGFGNEFAWRTKPVIRELEINPHDLGVIARLGYTTPTSAERIAPAILYHSRPPERIDAYVFTLKVGSDARVSCSIFEGKSDQRLFNKVFRRINGGRPFTVRWDASSTSPGFYKLVLSGYFLDTGQRLNQEVRFYHQARVR